MLRANAGMLHAFLAMRHALLVMRHAFLAMRHAFLAMRQAFLATLHVFLAMRQAFAATWCEGEDANHEESRAHHALRGAPDSSLASGRECVGSSSERATMRHEKLRDAVKPTPRPRGPTMRAPPRRQARGR